MHNVACNNLSCNRIILYSTRLWCMYSPQLCMHRLVSNVKCDSHQNLLLQCVYRVGARSLKHWHHFAFFIGFNPLNYTHTHTNITCKCICISRWLVIVFDSWQGPTVGKALERNWESERVSENIDKIATNTMHSRCNNASLIFSI